MRLVKSVLQLSCTQGWLTCVPNTGLAIVCWPDRVQGHVSSVLQLVRGRANFLTLMILGPAHSHVTDTKRWEAEELGQGQVCCSHGIRSSPSVSTAICLALIC